MLMAEVPLNLLPRMDKVKMFGLIALALYGCTGPDQACLDANTDGYNTCVDDVDVDYDACLDGCDTTTVTDDEWGDCADECDLEWDAAEQACADDAATKDESC